jgi:GT2 family glycosyltransferase
MKAPLVTVVILNYNGRHWLTRCLESLGKQTLLAKTEIVVADNASTDGSVELARELLARFALSGKVHENGGNFGYCEGNNRGAAQGAGKYLLFLNTDTWLEPDCLERLLEAAEAAGAESASPLVLEYENDRFQGNGANGFDLFGYLTNRKSPLPRGRIFAVPGCSLLVSRAAFEQVGGFDTELFMYADEADLAWRLTIAGALTVTVPEARVHHRGAVTANPKGGEKVVEFRTNEMVRFFATRNSLLVLLKNAQHVLLLLLLSQCVWVGAEMVAVLLLTRQWGVIRRAYLRAFADLWRLRKHIRRERNRLATLRRHGDFWMLRFLRLRPGRWLDIERLLRLGMPKVSPAKQ